MKRSTAIAPVALLCVAALQSCSPGTDAQAGSNNWEPVIRKLQADLEAAQKNIQELTFAKNSGEVRLQTLEGKDTVPVSVGDPGYAIVHTKHGTALITYDKVSPTADGFELLLRIGNLTGATFNGVKIGVDYGPSMPQAQNGAAPTPEQWKDYLDRQQHRDFDLATEIAPNRWNFVKLVVAPAKPDEVRQIEVSLEFNRLSMLAAPQPK